MNFGYDPVKQQYLQHLEGTFARNLAVNGNHAYTLGLGIRRNASEPTPSFAALEVYDISDPINPVWLSATEAVAALPYLFATYGHYAFEVDTGFFPGSPDNPPSRVALYNVESNPPTLVSYVYTPDLGAAFTNGGVIYGESLNLYTGATAPVYAYDIRSGTIQQSEIDVPPPPWALAGAPPVAIGNGNPPYAGFAAQSSGFTLATYDNRMIQGLETRLSFTIRL
jgi:hypothetical protein